jgi:predicted dehydrogenase
MKKIRVGVVGGGHIVAHRHLPVLRKLPNVEVSAICDVREDVARRLAGRFGIKKVYTSYADMLREELTVIDICTPPATHCVMSLQAMEAGSHVLMEKPFSMNVTEAQQMIDVAHRTNVKLCVVHQNLYNPAVLRAAHLVKTGRVGDIVGIEVDVRVRNDNYMCVNQSHWCHSLPGGIFFEILPHPVYLLQSFMGPVQIACVLTHKVGPHPWMKTDEISVLSKGSQSFGHLVASCTSPFLGDSLDILGTKASLQVDLWGRSVITHRPRTERLTSVGINNLRLAANFFGLIGVTAESALETFIGGVKVSAHYAFIRDFVESIRHNLNPPVDLEQAKENVRIVEEICRSIDSQSQLQ